MELFLLWLDRKTCFLSLMLATKTGSTAVIRLEPIFIIHTVFNEQVVVNQLLGCFDLIWTHHLEREV